MSKLKKRIFDSLQSELKGYPIWKENVEEISMFCSQIPDLYTNDNYTDAVAMLTTLSMMLETKGFEKDKYQFIEDEIKYLSDNFIIDKFTEKDNTLSDELIMRLIQSSSESEGVMGINGRYNVEQLKKISMAIYKKKSQLKFFISNEFKINGKITIEVNERAQDLPVISLIQGHKKNQDTDEYYQEIKLFGEQYDKKRFDLIKEIKSPFFIYHFIDTNNKEYIAYSPTKLSQGDYAVQGMVIENDDYKLVSESYKIKTKLTQLFIQSADAKKIEFVNHEQFLAYLQKNDIRKDTVYDYIFTQKKKDGKYYYGVQFDWYKQLIWSWLLHSKQGAFSPYPMHLFILGPRGSGKSFVVESLHEKSNETRDIISGSGSTMKNLIPSFKEKPARPGYFAESSRFAFCDEFLRCLNGIRNGTKDTHDESVGTMNDLLEHKKREVGSGVSRIPINMTARIIATSNPVMGIKSLNDLLHSLDESFVSRWLVYFQTDEDIKQVNDNKEEFIPYKYSYDNNTLLSIVDYLQSFDSKFEKAKLNEIFEEPKVLLNQKLLENYEARHKHHLQCLLDGIIKTRCLMENTIDFIANERDYEQVRIVWNQIIKSWINIKDIMKLPANKRIYYMPTRVQYVYYKICEQKRKMQRTELTELFEKEVHHNELYTILIILINNDLLFEDNGLYYPYWLNEVKLK